MKILAIESTCDETAAAVVENCGAGVKILTNIVASSAEIHQKYGGIVPEVAAREQIKSVVPVIREAINGDKESIKAVAVSYGPGLMGSLLIGVESAKALAWAWQKPLLPVNHMAAHIFANWIVENNEQEVPQMPAIGLVVSGGHTDLILMRSLKDWQWIGGTRDDAVGEAFDKTARLLGFPYPGGPEIQKATERVTEDMKEKYGKIVRLPRPMINEDNLEMSFSGLKAAVAKKVEEIKNMGDEIKDVLAWEFSQAIVEILIKKTMKAVDKYQPKCVLMAGGVAANKQLREGLRETVQNMVGVKFFCPELRYCSDNAAMVGAAAILAPEEAKIESIKPDPSLATV
ncbi:MAG TPA: tRNA (adenosine(37)-N6)-threonylcarbamoyltransferase complex transferase subunit TsaD [Candidatus Woesebacteria bacterium]|nr:tRNA (adenosine(37)-N6)-threonylcarbamoyltransferase complex transferase subunit TsaD [Candidatus Woesebacteria bacterium]